MIGTYELVVAVLSVIGSLSIVGVCLRQKCLTRYLLLNLYLVSGVAFTLGCLYFIRKEGYNSVAYFYFYYTGDAVVTVINYLLIGSFFSYLFRDSIFRKYVRLVLAFFFLGVVVVSGLFISGGLERLYSRWVIEFQQNMYFVGVLLTFLLWMTMTYLGAETRRFVLLVSGMGIFFAAHAANYALRFLSHSTKLEEVLARVPPLAYTFMVVLWLYTFWRVPEGEAAVEPVPRPEESVVKVKITTK